MTPNTVNWMFSRMLVNGVDDCSGHLCSTSYVLTGHCHLKSSHRTLPSHLGVGGNIQLLDDCIMYFGCFIGRLYILEFCHIFVLLLLTIINWTFV